MTYRTLFLDSNVILEILFKRDKYKECLDKCLEYELLCISSTSIHIIYYFIEKAKFDPKIIENLLSNIKILNCGADEYEIAKSLYSGKDMEDALQIAVAINNGITDILSLDKKMAIKYSHKINFV